MSSRGFHQAGEAFSNAIQANQNRNAINSPHEAFLQVWWGKFYEAYRSRFPDDAVLTTDSFDKVSQTVENIVADNSLHQSYASDHTKANISNVMPVMSSPLLMTSSPVMESIGPDVMDAEILNLLSAYDTNFASLDLSSQRDVTLGLQFPEIGEMGGMLPFARNSGYQMPTAPPKWNARDDRPGIDLGGPMLMEPSIHAPANALPSSLELYDSGNNISLQQASHQGWPSVMLVDTDQRTPEFLPTSHQKLAPMGGLKRRSGKQPAVQEKINQLGLQFSNKSGIKRKAPLSSLASVCIKATVSGVAKNKTISCYSQGDDGLVIASSSIDASTKKFATPQKENSFKEISNLDTKMSKLLCCHFNSKGELLATGGDNGKVLIWELGNNRTCSVQGHAHQVTDVCFRPNSTVFASSSFDRTVKIWDATKRSNPFQKLVGHDGHVMSIDFHPTKLSLLSSCDSNDEIRLWDVNSGDCKLNFKGGISQVRFQPQLGDFLASSTGNIINIFDVETNKIQKKLQGHVKDIHSICWEMSGSYLASVSEDSARIWSVSDGKCLYELYSSGNKFQSCTFHFGHPLGLVIGSDKLLEVWNPFLQRNITRPYSAHSGIITSLVNSPSKGIVASVSDDQWIKIWE
ncbi:transcriptional corepressor LEUNIG_HOMOLOG-like isoform X1 [Solanum tuberosum]|uniref:transcriptional corepressor LEUNIG_HOMOLOG-like isoform X1 n=1 Tax=Solanum tuberosum TaxID=4113 RepID=UPI0003D25310|nr:PREDICTED: transcriptional corepressor LEUNIG_HOMOLOG-like isoform X1 [Solanum tuberosum]XP_015158499.1 PREDICTED: transcriptional corepressor LEUNIG_HOMOLOG-like isoform X1 [Solanum tuberosum]